MRGAGRGGNSTSSIVPQQQTSTLRHPVLPLSPPPQPTLSMPPAAWDRRIVGAECGRSVCEDGCWITMTIWDSRCCASFLTFYFHLCPHINAVMRTHSKQPSEPSWQSLWWRWGLGKEWGSGWTRGHKPKANTVWIWVHIFWQNKKKKEVESFCFHGEKYTDQRIRRESSGAGLFSASYRTSLFWSVKIQSIIVRPTQYDRVLWAL